MGVWGFGVLAEGGLALPGVRGFAVALPADEILASLGGAAVVGEALDVVVGHAVDDVGGRGVADGVGGCGGGFEHGDVDGGVVAEMGWQGKGVGDGGDFGEDLVGPEPHGSELAGGGGGGGRVEVGAADPGEGVDRQGEVAAVFVGLGRLGGREDHRG